MGEIRRIWVLGQHGQKVCKTATKLGHNAKLPRNMRMGRSQFQDSLGKTVCKMSSQKKKTGHGEGHLSSQ
jgi:hypothetical protein